jgi:acetyl esterase/lipase
MDLTDAYENGAHIPGGTAYPAKWQAAAEAFRAGFEGAGHCDLSYGPGARHRYDLFAPQGAAAGLLVFIHGGYWKATSKDLWSHLAAGPLARGWAVAMPSYTLAPDAHISEITREIALAVEAAARGFTGPVVITGHSAGGHLTARMRCKGVLPDETAAMIQRVVPISPLSEMNAVLRIDPTEALAESPALLPDLHDIDTHVWVGGDERPVFLDQARWLSEAWGAGLTIDAGKHHFDVIEGMEQADSALMSALLDGVT